MTDVRLTFGGDSRPAQTAIDALVDAAQQLRATFRATNEEIAAGAERTARTVQETARENVASIVKQREELVALAAEYKAVAAAATEGSVEQQAAARLAAEANYKAAASLETSRAAAAANLGVIGRLAAATGGADGALGKLDRTLGGVQSSLLGVAGLATKVTALVGVGLAAGVAFVGLRFDSMKEQAQIAFTTLTGSATEAHKTISDLIGFAARTPFRVANITQTAQMLVAMGVHVKELIPTLRALGDAAAATGRGQEGLQRIALALGQIRNSASLHAQDMNQLIQAGINAWGALADASGKSIAQVRAAAQNGAISGRQAYDVLLTWMEHRFAGMMDKQSRTAAGLLSTLQDTFSIFAGQIMAPTFGILERQMSELADRFVDRSGQMTKSGQDLANELGVKVGGAVQNLIGWFRENWGAIVDDLGRAAGGAKEIGGALLTIIRDGAKVVEALGGPIDATKHLLAAFVALRIGVATTAAIFPILTAAGVGSMTAIRAALISTGIGALLAGLGLIAVEVITHWSKVKPFFQAAFAAIVEIAKAAFYTILQVSTGAIQGILYAFSKLPFGMGDPFKRALDGLQGFIDRFKPDFSNVTDAFQAGGDAAGRAFQTAADARIAATSGVTATGGAGAAAAGSPGRQGRTGGTATEATRVAGTTVVQIALGAAASPSAPSIQFHLPGERTPYDCSAFVQAAFRNAGLPDPGSTTYQQVHAGVAVDPSDLQPGDIVLWDVPSDSQPAPNHVGIYVGGGICVHDRGAHGGVDRLPWNYYRVVAIRRVGTAHRTLGKDKGGGAPPKLDLSGGKGKTTTPPDPTQMPDTIRIAFTRAERVGNTQAEIAALDQYVDYLRNQEKKGKQVASIEEAITQTILQIKQIREEQKRAATPTGTAGTSSRITFAGTINQLVRQELQDLATANLSPDSAVSRAVAALQKIRERLNSGAKITSTQMANLRNSYKRWGDTLRNAVKSEVDHAQETAQRAAEDAQTALTRSLSHVSTAVSRALSDHWDAVYADFDKQTSDRVKSMQDSLEAQVAALQVTVQTAYGSFRYGGSITQTPAEAALAALETGATQTDLNRQLSDAQTALERAKIIGDPVAIQAAQRQVEDAQLAVRRDALQTQADVEKNAAQSQLQQAQDDLRARLQLQIDAYQQQRTVQRSALDRQREDQQTTLDEMNDDLVTALNRGLITWDEYLRRVRALLAGQNVSVDLSGVNAPNTTTPSPPPPPSATSNPTTGSRTGPGSSFIPMQHGGFYRTPTPGLVASHEPEYVVADRWLDETTRARLRAILAAHSSPGVAAIPPGGSLGGAPVPGGSPMVGGGGVVYVYAPVAGSVIAEQDLALTIRDALVEHGFRTGGNVFGGQA